MRKIILLITVLLILPLVPAVNLNVEKLSSNEVMILGLSSPAVFNLKITNLGMADKFEFYNLLGFEMLPSEKVYISSGQTKNVELKISPIGDFERKGAYTFQYFIRGEDDTETKQELTFKVIELKDAFEIGSGEIDSESNSLELYIHNKENFNFGNVKVKLSSAFFNFEESFALAQNKRKNFTVQLDKEDFRKLLAGFYTLNAEVRVEDEKANIEGIIKFVEKDITTTTSKDYGFIIKTKIIEKINNGNVVAKSETVLKKNILSGLFTSFSPEPDIVERQGLTMYYTLNREIKPGETLKIVVKTNWLFPFLVIIFLVAIIVLAKRYSTANLILKKRISFVNAKGGEFALKVSILVHAKKYVERVNVIDRLPQMVKIYERFGGEKPVRFNEKNKKIEWEFEKLEEGEVRMVSYIIYSKFGVLGKFALPPATAIYEKEGEIKESESNRVFFMAEKKKGEVDE